MKELTLTPEQSTLILSSSDDITLRAPNGDYLGTINTRELAVIAKAKRRIAAGGPTIPHDAVMTTLAELQDEYDRNGAIDPAVVRQRFASLQAQATHD